MIRAFFWTLLTVAVIGGFVGEVAGCGGENRDGDQEAARIVEKREYVKSEARDRVLERRVRRHMRVDYCTEPLRASFCDLIRRYEVRSQTTLDVETTMYDKPSNESTARIICNDASEAARFAVVQVFASNEHALYSCGS